MALKRMRDSDSAWMRPLSERNLHVVGLPHTNLQSDGKFAWCAYTKKLECFVKMNIGKRVFVYSGKEYSEYAPGGKLAGSRMYESNPNINWDADIDMWVRMHVKVAAAISNNAEDGDILCLICPGSRHILKYTPKYLIEFEIGVGYERVETRQAAYEDPMWQSCVNGVNRVKFPMNTRPNDVVIPNYYDPNDYKVITTDVTDYEYVLLPARKIWSKGGIVVAQAVDMINRRRKEEKRPLLRFVMCGGGTVEGLISECKGWVSEETANLLQQDWVVHKGVVDGEEKHRLYSNALAVVMMTQYTAPFEGAHVEALFYGTRVIAPRNGAFITTVQKMQEYWDGVLKKTRLPQQTMMLTEVATPECLATAIEQMQDAKPHDIKDRYDLIDFAKTYFSIDVAKQKYEDWFNVVIAGEYPDEFNTIRNATIYVCKALGLATGGDNSPLLIASRGGLTEISPKACLVFADYKCAHPILDKGWNRIAKASCDLYKLPHPLNTIPGYVFRAFHIYQRI